MSDYTTETLRNAIANGDVTVQCRLLANPFTNDVDVAHVQVGRPGDYVSCDITKANPGFNLLVGAVDVTDPTKGENNSFSGSAARYTDVGQVILNSSSSDEVLGFVADELSSPDDVNYATPPENAMKNILDSVFGGVDN